MYKNYDQLVDPLGVRDVAVRLTAPLARAGYWNMAQAIALFEYVRSIPYVAPPLGRPDYVQTPADTVRLGAGHCEARALLFSSLLRAIGISSRLVAVQGREGNHLLTEIFLGSTYRLEHLHADLVNCGSAPAVCEKYRTAPLWRELDAAGNGWLIADATMSRFVGDIDPLIETGFATRWPPSWVWTNPPVYFSDGSTPSPHYEQQTIATLPLVIILPLDGQSIPAKYPAEVRAPSSIVEMSHP